MVKANDQHEAELEDYLNVSRKDMTALLKANKTIIINKPFFNELKTFSQPKPKKYLIAV